jgi:SAM-dependent methyltransferase
VDINQDICQYARHKAEAESLEMTITCGDMVEFSLPQCCDLAVSFFDSLTYVTDFQKLVRHFSTVSDILSPGGLYIVEVGVIDHFENHNVEEVWTENRRAFSVTSTYFRDGKIDPERRTFVEHCSFRAVCQDHISFFLLKLLKLALYFEEFNSLVNQAECFIPLAYYDDFEPDAFLPKGELPWRVIAVLRKQ